jgi:hypothetical protein
MRRSTLSAIWLWTTALHENLAGCIMGVHVPVVTLPGGLPPSKLGQALTAVRGCAQAPHFRAASQIAELATPSGCRQNIP